jgi:glycosyltransferase 2 family protein
MSEQAPLSNEEVIEKEERSIIHSLRSSRIILPILIGFSVVGYMFWKQFDITEFNKISWTWGAFAWVGLAILLLIIRHLAYAARIYTISQKQFSYLRCIEFIFLWEFSSAITPTALGGSAVALFFMSQEKVSAAKATSIVLYTVILDTFFFICLLPLLLLLLGPNVVFPGTTGFADLDYWGYIFFGTYLFMLFYGALFAYGLLINPNRTRSLLLLLTKLPLLSKLKDKAEKLGNEFVEASAEIRNQNKGFHYRAMLFTAIPWTCKFLLMVCLVYGIAPDVSFNFHNSTLMFGRMACMFIIILVSPTPGGAGFAEVAFGTFLSDFMNAPIALIVATIWRLLAYYSYLIFGAFLVPAFITRMLLNRRQANQKDKI